MFGWCCVVCEVSLVFNSLVGQGFVLHRGSKALLVFLAYIILYYAIFDGDIQVLSRKGVWSSKLGLL